MRFAATPPADVKLPPATNWPSGSTARADTLANDPVPTPAPSGNHSFPSQRATRVAARPPAEVKVPPATRSPFGITASAFTSPFIPDPSGNQAVPFHRAMCPALRPSAVVKAPAATTSPPGRTASAYTLPLVPSPMDDKAAPSHRAILLAATPPAVVKAPPATPSTGLVNQRPTHCAYTEQVASSPRRATHKRFAEGPSKCTGMSRLIVCNITGGYQSDSVRKDRESEGKRGMKREQIRCEPTQRTHPVTHAALALRLRCDLALVPTKARRHAVPEPSMSSAGTAAW